MATRNENKIAERNYAPNDNQEIKDFHPIDAKSSQNQRCQHPSPHKVRIVMPAITSSLCEAPHSCGSTTQRAFRLNNGHSTA